MASGSEGYSRINAGRKAGKGKPSKAKKRAESDAFQAANNTPF